MTRYAKHVSNKATSQSEQAKSNQVQNNAGGWTFQLDDWAQLDRWLVLGSEGGTYYASERKLTKDNAKTIERCLVKDGVKTVNRIVEMSEQGRAPKNDPAIFALALAASAEDEATRKAALAALPRVCRTGTHLFQFAATVNELRGWGRGLRKAVGDWYVAKDSQSLAYQVIKYQQRNGWSHRDVLRLAHPQANDESKEAIFRYIASQGTNFNERDLVRKVKNGNVASSYGPIVNSQVPGLIYAYEAMKKAKSETEVIKLISEYGMTHEMVTNEWKKSVSVWDALLQNKMPMTAMVRNLGKMTSIGLIKPLSNASKLVIDQLKNEELLAKARLHPITLLSALRTYERGTGVKGSLRWDPDKNVVSALEKAFYMSFQKVEPTNKRVMLGLDVSGSMTWGEIAGVAGLTPRVASAVMAMVTMKAEEQHYVKGFSHELVDVPINENMKLNDVINAIERVQMGGTDCALPMVHAAKNKLPVDTFQIYTDNETWYGAVHPFQALKDYRQKMGIPAKLIVVGMTATGFTIADPSDGGMLDVVGFDSAAPNIMADFAR